MWGIIPAAGKGTRIQPLAFSKELLPLAGYYEDNVHKPRAVSDFLVERMILAGARKLCFVISPEKSDIIDYYSQSVRPASICYTVQPRPSGLCDAIFRALPFIESTESAIVGLPDTIWFPENGLAQLPADRFSLLLFPVSEPQLFDAVEFGGDGRVSAIRVKQPHYRSHWIWGAFRLPASTLAALYELWEERRRIDEYIGTLVNAWLDRGGEVWGIPAGTNYYDVGTMDGYLNAMRRLSSPPEAVAAGGRWNE
jgi:dTDP-glucose pyrophosphorylase